MDMQLEKTKTVAPEPAANFGATTRLRGGGLRVCSLRRRHQVGWRGLCWRAGFLRSWPFRSATNALPFGRHGAGEKCVQYFVNPQHQTSLETDPTVACQALATEAAATFEI